MGADVEFAAQDAGGDRAGDAVIGPAGGHLGAVAQDAGHFGLQDAAARYVQLQVNFGFRHALRFLFRRRQRPVDALAAQRLGPLAAETAGADAVKQPPRLIGRQSAGQLLRKGGGVGGAVKGRRGPLRYGDVVGMAVQPVGAEGQHRLRPEPAHFQRQPRHHFGGIGVGKGAGVAVGLPAVHPRIAVVPDVVAAQPQGLHRAGKLHPADGPQRFPGGRAVLPDFPLLPGRGGKQAHQRPPPGVNRQRPAHRKRLIIRVRETGQQTVFGHCPHSAFR